MTTREAVELSDVVALQLECTECQDVKSFPLDKLDTPEKIQVHWCTCRGSVPDRNRDWMREVATIAKAVELVRVAQSNDPQLTKFRLAFLVNKS